MALVSVSAAAMTLPADEPREIVVRGHPLLIETPPKKGWRQVLSVEQRRRCGVVLFWRLFAARVGSRRRKMRNSIPKAIVAGLTALTMSAAVISSTTPASAVMRSAGGFGGGLHPGFGGGFHPGFRPGFAGGFHPGFHPGFVGVHPGFVGFHHRFFHDRFFHQRFFFVNGVWVNGWAGGYGNGCWDYRPIYDASGNFLGQQYINLCEY